MKKHIMKRRVWTPIIAATALALGLTACSSSAPPASSVHASPGVLSTAYKGTTIDVLLPPWATFKKDDLAKFTAKTGIKVNMQSLAWDSIHDKVVTAAASGQSPADVVEMDWTWVSQFGAAGWFQDLRNYLTPQQIKDSVGASTFLYKGEQIGLPYSLDFRGMEVNMTMLKKAGITTPPANWDDVLKDSAALQKSGVAHPVGLPLKILEGTATPWYALVRASGGQILTTTGEPAFNKGETGLKALEFIHELYSNGYVDPGSIQLTDVQVTDNFTAGQSAMILSVGPGSSSQFADPGKSSIANDSLVFTHIPGLADNTGATVGLEEGLSIPKASKKAGAAAMFITWWMKTPQLLTAYNDPDMGDLPTTHAALQALASSGKLFSSDTVLKMVGNIEPIVPGGTPTWYTKFSSAAASTIQSVAVGNEKASAGISSLAKQASAFAAQAK